MSNELANRESFSTQLSTSLIDVKEALPKDLSIPRFVQNAVALLNDNPTLTQFAQKYGTTQIKQGLMKAAYLGLDFINKECYLIPFANQISFMIDYRGNIKLAKKYSIIPIKDIYAKIVREGDNFEEKIVNGEPTIDFTPKPFNDGKIIGAFAVCLYKDGGMVYDTMSIKDLENTRSASKSKNSPAWQKFTGEMYKKTVLHRLCKHIELEFDTPQQSELFVEDVAIETDTQKLVEREIEENANAVEFEFVDGEIVEE